MLSARSDPKAAGRLGTGVALFVTGRTAILRQAYSQSTDDPRIQIPDPRFTGPVATSAFYSAYERCTPRPLGRATRWPWAVAGVLALSFLLRVWGVKQGLPFAYNADENAHFVPKAIGFFGHSYNPQYFINPPAYTYLLHVVFAVWFGGRDGVSHAYATDPTSVFVVARITAGLLGTLAVWLVAWAGARMFERRVGLVAAALLGVAFLPVHYSHLALNDVPTLAAAALSFVGTAGRPAPWPPAGLRGGRRGARARLRDEVHGGRRRAAAADRGGRGRLADDARRGGAW